MPHNFSKVKLRRDEMWEKLTRWIESQNKLEQDFNDRIHAFEVLDKMKEIEKEYGIG
jgi:hypothetical protein